MCTCLHIYMHIDIHTFTHTHTHIYIYNIRYTLSACSALTTSTFYDFVANFHLFHFASINNIQRI